MGVHTAGTEQRQGILHGAQTEGGGREQTIFTHLWAEIGQSTTQQAKKEEGYVRPVMLVVKYVVSYLW